ncbi:MAG TPA: hypothetical protein VFX07_01360 [Candidatus Udaeobacter sp.]|nr:hypothetical protein [Candidatus Udaeobacter sp.]
MSTKTQKVNTRLVPLGCLLVILFLSILATPRIAAQRDVAENAPDGGCFGSPLWDQYNSAATQPPLGIGSQQFESAMAVFDSQAADDFAITPGSTGSFITGVRVMGEYSDGGGPASSFNIYFYQNAAGNLPGTLIAAFLNLSYTGVPPDFLICLPSPFGIAPGNYWVSVQARQDSNPNGQWFWHNRTIQSHAGAAWQNPGDGYGTSCITWNPKNACMADQVSPDQVFQILGFHEGPLPTPRPFPTPRSRPTPVPHP